MVGPIRGMPGSSARSQGRRMLSAMSSAKKSGPPKHTPARASAQQQATPHRIGPSAAEYSNRKRPRAADADRDLEEDDLAPRPAQRRSTTVTPKTIAAAGRSVKSTPATTPQTIQVTPPVHSIFNSFHKTTSSAPAKGLWRRQDTRRPSSPLGYRRPTGGPSGLVNLGNTCYLNAVLQSLFSLPTFPSAVRAAAAATRAAPGSVLSALAGALAQRDASTASARSAFSPDAVKAAVSARQGAFRGTLQHDAHEFFCGLLEATQEEVLAAEAAAAGRPRLRASESVDPVTRVFGFAVKHGFRCSACGHESSVVEECTHLSLDLPLVDPKNPSQVPPALEVLLNSYFAEEQVEKACEGCGAGNVAHSAQRRVRRMPRVLALYLKRFQVTLGPRGTVECNKLRTPIDLKPSLRMRPFVLDNAAAPLPPLQPTRQASEKENRGDNAAKAASTVAAAVQPAAHATAPSPAARHAGSSVGASTFYSSGTHDVFGLPPPHQPPLRTFHRKQPQRGAAAPGFWDGQEQKKPIGKVFSSIVSAAGSPVGGRKHAGDCEEEAALARALRESAAEAEAAAKAAAELDQEDEDLATAIKRSLEEEKAKEEEAAVAAAAAADLEPWMTADAGLGENNNNLEWYDAATPVPKHKTSTAAADAAPPPGPPLEIVEDDANVGIQGGSQASGKADGGVTMPLILGGAEIVPNSPKVSTVFEYHIKAVISHHGPRVESGHFTADAKDPMGGAWHRFNDAQVTQISGAVAMGPAAQRDCYMVFYSVKEAH